MQKYKRKVQKTALFPGGPTGFIIARVASAKCEPRCVRCCALGLVPCALGLGQIEGRPLSEDVRQDGDNDDDDDYGSDVNQKQRS